MEGMIKIPYKDAIKLIGPDSAYRLYFSHKGKSGPGEPIK